MKVFKNFEKITKIRKYRKRHNLKKYPSRLRMDLDISADTMHHGFESANISRVRASRHRYGNTRDSEIGIVPALSISVTTRCTFANHALDVPSPPDFFFQVEYICRKPDVCSVPARKLYVHSNKKQKKEMVGLGVKSLARS